MDAMSPLPQVPAQSGTLFETTVDQLVNATQDKVDRVWATGQSLLCGWDSISTLPWWKGIPAAYLCFDDETKQSLLNYYEGARDLVQITASFAFMFFLMYLFKRPENDEYHSYRTIVIAPAGMMGSLSLPSLQEAVKVNSLIPLALANDKVDPNSVSEECVEITPNLVGFEEDAFEPFHLLKKVFQNHARELRFSANL